ADQWTALPIPEATDGILHFTGRSLLIPDAPAISFDSMAQAASESEPAPGSLLDRTDRSRRPVECHLCKKLVCMRMYCSNKPGELYTARRLICPDCYDALRSAHSSQVFDFTHDTVEK